MKTPLAGLTFWVKNGGGKNPCESVSIRVHPWLKDLPATA
jgi:hypothetical protein